MKVVRLILALLGILVRFYLLITVTVFLTLRGNAQTSTDGGFRIGCNYWASHAGMKMWSRWDALNITIVAAAIVTAVSLPGIADECRAVRPQYVCYRSFRPQLERTKGFAEMGIPIRCFFAANTINAAGDPYCDYPLIWKGFQNYDWKALDAQIEDFLKVSTNAEFLCMIDLNTPYWATHKFWLDSFTDITHAASDPNWIERTTEWMLDFIAYAEKKWGSRIRAYILSCGER